LGIIEFLIQDALTNVESFHLDMMWH
jgi:hypothetical protein